MPGEQNLCFAGPVVEAVLGAGSPQIYNSVWAHPGPDASNLMGPPGPAVCPELLGKIKFGSDGGSWYPTSGEEHLAPHGLNLTGTRTGVDTARPRGWDGIEDLPCEAAEWQDSGQCLTEVQMACPNLGQPHKNLSLGPAECIAFRCPPGGKQKHAAQRGSAWA